MMRRTLRFLVNFEAIAMPALSPSMETGTVVEWKKKIGDLVKEGELFCTVQTDKAVVDYTNSFDEGFLAKIFVQNGEVCEVGKTIAVMVDAKEDVGKADQYVPEGEASPEGAAASSAPPPPPTEAPPPAPSSAGNAEPPEGVSLENIAMPALSPSMETGTVVEWKKKIGDLVKEGELFCTVQTDKAVVDYTNSFDEGFLAKIFVQNGEVCEVGKTIAVLVSSADDIPKVANYHPSDAPGAPAAAPAPSSSSASAPAAAPSPSAGKGSTKRFGGSLEEAIKASGPSVIRIAAGLDDKVLQGIPSTGKGGRFLKSDFVGQPGFDYNDTVRTAAKADRPSSKPAGGSEKPASPASQEGIYDVELKAGPVVKSVNDTGLLRRLLRTMPIPPKKQVKA